MKAEPIKVEIDVETVGKSLAHASDWEQGAIINSMASEMKISMAGRKRDVETQLCYMSDKLDIHGQWLIMELAEFVRLRQESEKGK